MGFQGRAVFEGGTLVEQWEEGPIRSNLPPLPELPPEFFEQEDRDEERAQELRS